MADQFRQIATGPLNVVVHLLFVCVVCPSRLDGAEVRMQASHMIRRKDIWKNHVTLYFKVLDALAQRKRSPVSVDNSISQNAMLPRGKSCVTPYMMVQYIHLRHRTKKRSHQRPKARDE